MKKILILPLLLIGLFLVYPARAEEAPPNSCPPGSYNIEAEKAGEVLCRLEPTGCPYGDSIPLGPECDKHKPKDLAPVESIEVDKTGK